MLNNTVIARIEVPSKEDLRLPSAGAIPRHCGHNWDDAANQPNHFRKQVLQSEKIGKRYGLVASGTVDRSVELPVVTTAAAARLHGAIQAQITNNIPEKEKPTLDNLLLSTNRYDLSGRKLSFNAWFTERVPESAIEKVRTRFVAITFFLEDETVSVFEPLIASSGLNGGYILRRTKVPLTEIDASRRAPPSSDGSRFRDLANISEKHITILDFNVGRELILFGVNYHLHACDSFTRDVLTTVGVDAPENSEPPVDRSFVTYRGKMTGFTATLPSSARLDPMRGPKATKATRQKAEHTGIVLRFFAIWNEETTMTNNEMRQHKFEFHYFLEDDTISLREREWQATGGEIIARHFLKRIKLPKSGNAGEVAAQSAAIPVVQQRNGATATASSALSLSSSSSSATSAGQFYSPLDFTIGAHISAFGRQLTLVDCDEATRRYYLEKYGIELGEPILVSTVKPQPPETIKAASTELALLTREPPKPKSTLILKYELALDKPETGDDALRRFVLTFYAADGEVAIGELVQRNSGFGGGRVLKKSVLMIPTADGGESGSNAKNSGATQRRLTSDDLVVGRVLKVYGRTFRIIRLSERAEAFANSTQKVEGGSSLDDEKHHAVSAARLKQLITTFRDHVLGRYITLAEAFRVFDQDADGKLTEFELRMFLAKHDLSRSESEAVALINAFSPNGNGEISFADFVKGCTFGIDGNTSAIVKQGASASKIAAEATRVRSQADKQVLHVANRALLSRLRSKLEVRYLNVSEMFRAMSTMPRKWPAMIPPEDYARDGGRATLNALTNPEKDCVVTPVQFRRVLVERLGMNVSPSEMAVLLKCFYPDLPESEYNSSEDVDAKPPRALRLEDMQRILTNHLRA